MTRFEEPHFTTIPIGDASLLPACTGVYMFGDRHGSTLYVGKAKDLRRRVAQHLLEGRHRPGAKGTRTGRKRILMTATRSVTWQPAETELEALLLEDSLIKKYRPAFNRRQNKFTQLAYLRLSLGGIRPTVRVTDQPETSGSFGPFADRFFAQRVAAILDEQFGISSPYCAGLQRKGPEAAAAVRFLQGYDDGIIWSLQEQTRRRASELQFERAAKTRDEVVFCQRFLRRQAFTRAFSLGILIVSEAESPNEGLHYLFVNGRLADRARGGIPECWKSDSARPVNGAEEPQWMRSERALVVYAWLSANSRRRSVQILGEHGSSESLSMARRS